jgi:predicted oxidoreductase (fatty acid repression mutant protein)
MQEDVMARVHALSRNSQIHLFLIVASLLLIIVPVLNKTPSQATADSSIRAAAHFLFLVDTEEYAKSWDVTSDVLKNMLSQKAWNQQIEKIRSFLGPIVERIVHDIAYTETADDVPAGEYVILTFVSRFELRERVIETITLMLGDDDQWQVVGYFLK